MYDTVFQDSCGPSYACICVLFLCNVCNCQFFSVFLIIIVCLCLCVGVDVSVPDGSAKKNFSGETKNRDRCQRASSDPQLKDLCASHTLEHTVGAQYTHTHKQTVHLRMSHSVISCK